MSDMHECLLLRCALSRCRSLASVRRTYIIVTQIDSLLVSVLKMTCNHTQPNPNLTGLVINERVSLSQYKENNNMMRLARGNDS